MQQLFHCKRRSGNSPFMNIFLKIIFILICILQLPPAANAARWNEFVIDAERNANNHNNLGVIYMQDRYYAAAIKEFQMAVLINPDTQATATYYANLGTVYMKIGYPALAQDVLERAIKLNPQNFSYYQDLAVVYAKQKILPLKLKQYAKDTKNPLSTIMVGLIKLQQGKTEEGLSNLQEFCFLEPDLIITKGVQDFIDQKTKKPAPQI